MSGDGIGGAHVVACKHVRGEGAAFHAFDPANGATLEPAFADADAGIVAKACEAARAAEDSFASVDGHGRAAFLRAIARELESLGDRLLLRAARETGLPNARLVTERGRTMFQLETFARVVEEGSWIDARIDRADPTRKPAPKPDLRAMLVPLGPVAVFGASNFPLAYSVAGGDTASALAAGCPVVVKAHPMHPGTSELAAEAIVRAARASGMPQGVFSMVHGRSHEVGRALVENPAIAAVGFTGSKQGGAALFRVAASRDCPIPVFAEMGSVNPVFVLPAALAARGGAVGSALAGSALLACGQFCTSPGMVAFVEGPGADSLVSAVEAAIAASTPGTFVHADIRSGFDRAITEVEQRGEVKLLAAAKMDAIDVATTGRARAYVVDAGAVLRSHRLREEIYGPAFLLVRCRDAAEMLAVAESMQGHLTATVHAEASDLPAHEELLRSIRKRVGRIVHNGVPTGVEVCAAMQHGGPWPASSDSRFTAVGARAILRWARTVAFQDAPDALLPAALRDGNPLGIWRTVDGALGKA